jgi:hypothetical protein
MAAAGRTSPLTLCVLLPLLASLLRVNLRPLLLLLPLPVCLVCCRLLEGRVPATWARYSDAAAGEPQHDGGGLHTAGMVTRLRNRGAAVLQRVLRKYVVSDTLLRAWDLVSPAMHGQLTGLTRVFNSASCITLFSILKTPRHNDVGLVDVPSAVEVLMPPNTLQLVTHACFALLCLNLLPSSSAASHHSRHQLLHTSVCNAVRSATAALDW